jgi:hypothetical protein
MNTMNSVAILSIFDRPALHRTCTAVLAGLVSHSCDARSNPISITCDRMDRRALDRRTLDETHHRMWTRVSPSFPQNKTSLGRTHRLRADGRALAASRAGVSLQHVGKYQQTGLTGDTRPRANFPTPGERERAGLKAVTSWRGRSVPPQHLARRPLISDAPTTTTNSHLFFFWVFFFFSCFVFVFVFRQSLCAKTTWRCQQSMNIV